MLRYLSLLLFICLIFPQIKETSDLSTLDLEDSVTIQNRIRLEKFDKILPRAMHDNNIDMWIHILRPWTSDPLQFEIGASEGVFIFTNRGLKRIERAAFCADIQDPTAYDLIFEEGMERESKPGTPLEMDFRFVGLRKFVSERNPKQIGVNYMDELSTASSSEGNPLSDGISYKDYNLLIEALGENYRDRIRSAEYVIMDYLAGRVPEEIKLYQQFGMIAANNLDREFKKVVPGLTKLSDLEGNVFLRVPDGREIHANDPIPYVLKRGDLFTILHGAGTNIFHADLGGNAYILKNGELKPPPEIQEIWKHAMVVRKILKENIKAGRTAGKTLEILIAKIEEAGYYYNPVDSYDENADPIKTQIHLDCHAVGRSGFIGPRISPFGPDWLRKMKIPLLHTFTFEYMVHMPVPKWGKGKHIYIAFHDGAIVTKEGVMFPYPPDQKIRIIR